MSKIAALKVDLIAQTDWNFRFLNQHSQDEMFKLFQFHRMEPAVKVTEFAGRLCYMSFEKPRPGGEEAYIENVLAMGHGSVLEHVSYSFWIQGVSRTLTHELVRHRAGWAYSQLSQRFVDSKSARFVVPPAIDELPDGPIRGALLRELETSFAKDVDSYISLQENLKELLPEAKKKQVNEASRSVMANMTETKIVATCNARALRHFLTMRGALGADAEIRRLALAMYTFVKDSLLFKDFSLEKDKDTGFDYLTCKYPKV